MGSDDVWRCQGAVLLAAVLGVMHQVQWHRSHTPKVSPVLYNICNVRNDLGSHLDKAGEPLVWERFPCSVRQDISILFLALNIQLPYGAGLQPPECD